MPQAEYSLDKNKAFYACDECGHIRQYGNSAPPIPHPKTCKSCGTTHQDEVEVKPLLKCKGCYGKLTRHIFRNVVRGEQ